MNRKEIAWQELNLNSMDIWSSQGFALGAGDFLSGEYNAMTVG